MEKTREDMIAFILGMMDYWEITIFEIFKDKNKKILIVDKDFGL